MKRLAIILFFLGFALSLFAQQTKKYIRTGNEQYKQKNYTGAESNYRKAAELNAKNPDGSFNLGDALYKQKKYTDAGEYFTKIGSSSANKMLAAGAYHNLGNSYLESKKLEESISAYKKSLIDNPNDEQTRYNLAYAQQMLKKQQQQKQQDKNKQDQQKKNKQEQQKDQQNKDNKNQDDKDKPKSNKDQQEKQQQPDQLSKEDAERMLDAMNNDEKQTQDKLKNKKLQGAKLRVLKDW